MSSIINSFISRANGRCDPPTSNVVRFANCQKLTVRFDSFRVLSVCCEMEKITKQSLVGGFDDVELDSPMG